MGEHSRQMEEHLETLIGKDLEEVKRARPHGNLESLQGKCGEVTGRFLNSGVS